MSGVGFGDVIQALTPRQVDVLRLLVKGLSYKQIARELGISRQRVKNLMVAIYERLRVYPRCRIMAILEAWRRGEIELFDGGGE